MRLERFFPFLQWRALLSRENLKADALAGAAGAILVLPQGIAFAALAGMPPEYGLYAAMVPTIIAALFGSSRHLVTGPSTIGALLVFATLHNIAAPETPEYIRLAFTLAFLTGVFQLLLGAARMGWLVDFVSQTVVTAYVTGAAVWIFSSQIGSFFGIELVRGASLAALYADFFAAVDRINPYAATVAVVSLIACILTRRYLARTPYMLIGILAGTVCAALLNALYGADTTRIETVDAISAAFPPLSTPDFSWSALQLTLLGALVLTLLNLTESVSIARAIALRTDQIIDNNQTFIGQGAANVLGSFFSSYPTSGSFNRTGLNYAAGARTPMSAIFSSLLLLALLLFLAPLARYLPMPAMAAVLFMVAYSLINVAHLRSIARTSPLEVLVFAATFAATLIDLRFSIFIGMGLSLAIFVYKSSRPIVTTANPSPEPGSSHFIDGDGLDPECPSLKMLRINGAIYFGAANFIQQALLQVDRDNPLHKHVLIVARGIHYVDAAGAQVLAQEARRRKAMGGGLYFYRLNDAAHALLRRGGYLDDIGAENFFPTQTQVVENLRARIRGA